MAPSRTSRTTSDGGPSATPAPVVQAGCPPAAASMERAAAGRLQSQRDMLRELEELEAAVQNVANELKSRPAKSTAAQKWQFAHGVARKAPRIEAWGSGHKHVNGTYNYLPPADEQKRTGPATYQSASDPDHYLYVSMRGSWFLGNLESKDAREQKQQQGYLRSAMSVEPGVLPHMTGPGWEVLAGVDFVPKETMKFWLTETVRLEWQKARVDLGSSPVIGVTGVSELADGLFDFVPAQSSPGEPPVFQHQRLRSVWMFLGTDQRWWIGGTSDKNSRTPHGIGHTCGPIQPGVVPTADMTFVVSVNNAWEERGVRIQRVDGLRACDCWAEASRRTGPLELWGSSELFGAFVPEAGERGQPPVYRCEKDDSAVFFMGEDGHWWLGAPGEGGRLKEGRVRSLQSVEPGTLPDDPSVAWLEKGASREWSRASALRFCAPEAVAAAWRVARKQAAADLVVSLTGSPCGLEYDGLYDYIAEEGREDGPPCFMHQINQELWIYLGADGCWWVGAKEFVAGGLTKGRLCTGPVGPGDLPLDPGWAAQWQSWSSDAKAWVAQPGTSLVVS